MGQPDSVWRLTSYLRNLYVKISLGFPKADFVGRFFVIVRRLTVVQNRKQRLATNKAPTLKYEVKGEGSATPSIILRIKNGMSLGTKVRLHYNKPTSQTKARQQVRFLSGCPTFL